MSADYWQAAQWDEWRWIDECNELAQEAGTYGDSDENLPGMQTVVCSQVQKADASLLL
jgi:hypothetical protein